MVVRLLIPAAALGLALSSCKNSASSSSVKDDGSVSAPASADQTAAATDFGPQCRTSPDDPTGQPLQKSTGVELENGTADQLTLRTYEGQVLALLDAHQSCVAYKSALVADSNDQVVITASSKSIGQSRIGGKGTIDADGVDGSQNWKAGVTKDANGYVVTEFAGGGGGGGGSGGGSGSDRDAVTRSSDDFGSDQTVAGPTDGSGSIDGLVPGLGGQQGPGPVGGSSGGTTVPGSQANNGNGGGGGGFVNFFGGGL